jgi:trigger factor
MTDEPKADTPVTEDDGSTAVAEAPAQPVKLTQTVDIRDIGPCKKHIKVSVDRKAIDDRLNDKFKELGHDAPVAGFRPGKAPRKIIEKRFRKDVGDQVKTEVLLASLEQLAEENDVAPLAAPNIDPSMIELPEDGPLVYEFEVEVRPQFDLPNYKGLKIRRPVHTFTDDEVAGEERRLLIPYGQIVPKPEGNAEDGDILVADITTRDGDRVINTVKEATFRIEKQLAFRDGMAANFADQVRGAKAGDSKIVDVKLSDTVSDEAMRGKTLKATFEVKEIKRQNLPELTHEFLHVFGVHSPGQLRELCGVILQRRLEYQQRQAAREQVTAQVVQAINLQLPQDLLMRQASRAMNRRVMEMRSEGLSDQEIASRRRLLEQDILGSTEVALKEHFVLQKIAEVEKIDIDEDDMDREIERLAAQSDENPRRLRARLERDDLLDALAAEMIERKALDLILDSAEYEDYELGKETQAPEVATIEEQAVPGEMRQLDAEGEAAAETTDPS